jgi:hypothetical protein
VRRRVTGLRAAVFAGLLAAAPVHAQSLHSSETAAGASAASRQAAAPADAAGLNPGPPGPFVVDLRGAMSGLPQTASYYAPFPIGTVVAKRGFGFDIGGHVYPFRLGTTRIGVGVDVMQVRGTASTIATTSSTSTSTSPSTTPATAYPDVASTVRLVVSQLSINFGTRDGWSYLSIGGDVGQLASSGRGAVTVPRDTHTLSGFNAGGGARWFLGDHLGVGFDVRLHRFSTTTLVSGTAGITLR